MERITKDMIGKRLEIQLMETGWRQPLIFHAKVIELSDDDKQVRLEYNPQIKEWHPNVPCVVRIIE